MVEKSTLWNAHAFTMYKQYHVPQSFQVNIGGQAAHVLEETEMVSQKELQRYGAPDYDRQTQSHGFPVITHYAK